MNNNKIRVLVVDDDPRLRKLLHRYLEQANFEVLSAGDGCEMQAMLASQQVDLIILDIMLPGEDGICLARKLGPQSAIPIIMLSAKGSDVDRIVGLEVGADDYITKPFNPRELLARIRAVLRRQARDAVHRTTTHKQNNMYCFGNFKLDITTHTLYHNGRSVTLTSADYKLLCIFVQYDNKVLSRDRLLDLLKGHERFPFDRSVDVRVSRLRQKIEADPSNPRFIRTIWGEGYMLSTPVTVE